MNIVRTNSANQNFIELVKHLDADLAIRDGDEHAFYDQFNKIDALKYVVVAFEKERAVGCGAIKKYNGIAMEVKRMFVPPEERGKGIASAVLQELENWSAELGYKKCVLETGVRQPEAISLYMKNGYSVIPNYGQYAGMQNSVCFEKNLG